MSVVDLRGREGAGTAGRVLGEAFADDPVWSWLVRGRDRDARLRTVFAAVARAAQRRAGARVLATAEQTAAAVWLPPGLHGTDVADVLLTGPVMVRGLRAGVLRGARLQAVLERHRPEAPHWYLEVLGAVPHARGTGSGRRVVEPVLAGCDDAGLTAYLESSNPRNWPFYERLGFVRGEPLPVPRGCPLMVPMTRAPR
ncbi:MAG: GNAT family N-acetyltransferase [Actinomycetes bacterium]